MHLSRCTSTTCKGENAHHQAETVFKAFARALRMALEMDPRAMDTIASTKARCRQKPPFLSMKLAFSPSQLCVRSY
jgi:hypothetical protein